MCLLGRKAQELLPFHSQNIQDIPYFQGMLRPILSPAGAQAPLVPVAADTQPWPHGPTSSLPSTWA